MNKLTLDALKQRADAVATDELLGQISGGTENACHDEPEGPSGWEIAAGIIYIIITTPDS